MERKIKIYIHTDLEGISCIDKRDMINDDSPRRREAIKRLMADTNAAIEGAFQGGATDITVLDSHSGGNNFDLSLLDKRVILDDNSKRWYGNMDNSYQGTFFIGAHAMAGTINAFYDHTWDDETFYNYYINGKKTGELGIWALVAGHFNIPMLMVSGDEAACIEARRFFNPLEYAVVKTYRNRNQCDTLDSQEALDLIRKAAKKAISLIGKAKPYTTHLPAEIKVELKSPYHAEVLNESGRVERLDGRNVRRQAESFLELPFMEEE